MARSFRQGDLTRALRAAKAAGFDRVDFDPLTGRYVFVKDGQVVEPEAESGASNFFDRVLKNGDDGNPESS